MKTFQNVFSLFVRSFSISMPRSEPGNVSKNWDEDLNRYRSNSNETTHKPGEGK